MRSLRILFCLLLWSASLAQAADRLPPPVAQALQAAGIPTAHVAVVVQEPGKHFTHLNVNAAQPMNPASVMKLLTTYAGLEILGPAYTWRTELRTRAMPMNGVLAGDIYLRGSGDPRLSLEQFWLLLRQLRAQGVREIRGDLVLDRSALQVVAADTPFDDQPMRPYNVQPDALLLNWKALRLQLDILADTATVRVRSEPMPANLDIANRLLISNEACGEWRERLRAEVLPLSGERFQLVLNGVYPRSCGEQTWNVGVLDHPHYVAGVFRELWEELGGSFRGTVRDGIAPPDASVLAAIDSPPLSELIRDINKFSNNVMARQLFLTLGGRGAPEADAAVRAWLARRNLSMPELVLENGAGLSRRERISAISLTRLLDTAWESALMPEFVASLPIAAMDGTMKKRLRDSAAAGQAHLKTGTLDGVKTLAGYVRNKNGKWQIVVFLINHANAAAGQAAQDALVQWVSEH